MANTPIDPVPNNAACEQVLQDTHQGTLVMCHESIPYAVPMNHAFVGGRFYFHCGLRGHKIDLLKQNPNVVYVVTKHHGASEETQTGDRCHGPWESLIAYGTARVIEDEDGKTAAFRTFMACYGKADYQMSEQARTLTSAIVIEVTSM
ncbi:MAG: pyridoxamine 5'-phosphate oxidase family protein, partial [Armatimonadota bacterium]